MESELSQLGGEKSRPQSRLREASGWGNTNSTTVLSSGVSLDPSEVGPRLWGADTREAVMGRGLDEGGGMGQEPWGNEDEDDGTDPEPKDVREMYNPTGQARYEAACEVFGVVPISYFLCHMHDSELTMMHHGLGPQGTKALAVPLVTNTYILKLNLRDNWMEAMGGAALAEMLKENCYITDIDLSENRLGDMGASAISNMLLENTTLIRLNLSANNFGDQAAAGLARAFVGNLKLQDLDLSRNTMGEMSGEILGDAIAENTGLRKLNLAWNCIRGKGTLAVAKGLGANIFLRVLDLSYNGFAGDGAAALGQALKANNVLEELNVSNNRIPPDGAIRFATGLRVNKTIKSLNMSRNPLQSAGCYGVLKAIQGNPGSAVESLDFSDISVNKDFEDLCNAVKGAFPGLQVKHGGSSSMFRRGLPATCRPTC
ncbi:uncharacterized protein lrrc74b [Paramormyrops kingsleyae]|uniref:Leucine rich repeat containing 74B n=1 Tax=Paramormyrops kingsleyae TaxID=1676925 RepID=A0A3B3SQ81_9TELE|nr:leucine-rich repeat-containing protein 74B [Paramormyrops kingsleyae]XP_023684703.1 leucine-rich repeat-containing protein 74B [Paramormyrops kingsleyae]